MNPNPTTPKTIRSILEQFCKDVQPVVYMPDVLPPHVKQERYDQVLADIVRIVGEEKVEMKKGCFDGGEFFDGFISGLDNFERNLRSRLG